MDACSGALFYLTNTVNRETKTEQHIDPKAQCDTRPPSTLFLFLFPSYSQNRTLHSFFVIRTR
jgi:hypothetical protein